MKFSIRDLMWLTVVVALAVGWWVDSSRRTSKETEEELKKLKVEMKMLKEENFGLAGTLALAREIQEINKSTIEKLQRQLQNPPKP